MSTFKTLLIVLNAIISADSTTVNRVSNEGNFWHVTDMHHDIYYNLSAPSSDQVCPSSSGAKAENPGIFGDYRCDAPWQLIESAVNFMASTNQPDFIIWTGDDTLHTSDEDKFLSEDIVVDIVSQQTKLFSDKFPGVPLYPSLGNHDYHLKNQVPTGNSYILSRISEIWCPLIPQDQCDFFNNTGSYMVDHDENLRIISLNTIVWYKSNKQVDGTGDPNMQFEWLESALDGARELGKKVYVIGHIPPGYFELVDDVYWLYPEYSRRFVSIVNSYSDVITGQFFGHHHTDSYRMLYDENNAAKSVIWIAPGVTPWMTTLPGTIDGANNPGVRLFQYDTDTCLPMDYTQYYMDLEESNNKGEADWKVEYSATDAFDIEDLSVSSMQHLTEKLQSAEGCDECEFSETLQQFALHNSVSYVLTECDEKCQRQQICAIVAVEAGAHTSCINRSSSAARVQFNLCLVASYLLACFLL